MNRLGGAWGHGIVCAAFAMLTGLAVACGGPAHAQEKPAPKPDAAAAIVLDLDDIEKLRSLGPLKLDADQMDKLIAAITALQADYDKKVTALGASIFGPTAPEVHDVKKAALGGSAIPKTFDDKMRKLQDDFFKQRDDLNTANIKAVAAACKAILTDKQVAIATKLERDQWNKDHPDGKGATDPQLYNLYCVDMFIASPRAVPLLKEMRAAAK
ncbi:MAG TPA: hypothetical protein VKT77_06485 [Chthonomonadaceae bacterium]|nr:hypothetical protein [Chthonomonadaceae bacterium]